MRSITINLRKTLALYIQRKYVVIFVKQKSFSINMYINCGKGINVTRSLKVSNTDFEANVLTFIEPDQSNCTIMSNLEIIELANIIGYKYIAPVIFAIGLLGNVANVIILRNRKKFSGRLYIYLRALAITDIICLSFAASGIIHQMQRPYTFDENHIGEPLKVI